MTQKYINKAVPPVVWSTIDDAFTKINDNFTELFLTIGGSGVNLEKLGSSVSPSISDTFSLGSSDFKWNNIFVTANGIHVGNATINAVGTAINLPEGTTINGSLIKDPTHGSFNSIVVPGQDTITSVTFDKSLKLIGNNINITTNASESTITLSNPGVTSLSSGNGISISAATGSITISNTGLVSVTASTGISASTVNGAVTLSNTGVTRIEAGTGMSVSTNTGVVTVTNISPNTFQNLFKTISVSGQTDIVAPSPVGVLTFAAGNGITITTSGLTNTVTINSTSITKDTLKLLVADSISFSDFQLKMAML